MPKVAIPLTDTKIKKTKSTDKIQKISDGKGLYLIIQPSGTKFFRYDFSFNGKRKSMSLGIYPEITLAKARELRDQAKENIINNINPIEIKKGNDNTFKNIANNWLEKMKIEWEDSTYHRVENLIRNHAYPYIGSINIKDIQRKDILSIIDKTNKKELYTSANRLIGMIERIFKYAVTYGYCDHNIIADIDKKNILVSTKNNHMAAITSEKEFKELLKDMENYSKIFRTSAATLFTIKLMPYLPLRPLNLRTLEWSEVNFEEQYLDIKAKKMKMKKDFIMPLSKQAIKILNEIKSFSYHNSKYVLPSPVGNNKPLSTAALSKIFIKLDYQNVHSPHGFRSTFSTICHEKYREHGFSSDIIEACLAHSERNLVKAAYNRESKNKYLDEKRELMQWWADYLDTLKRNQVS